MFTKCLTLVMLILSVSQCSRSEWITCNAPKNFTVDLSSGLRAIFFRTTLALSVDFDKIEFHGFKDSNVVHIKSPSIGVGFTSEAQNEIHINDVDSVFSEVEKVSQSHHDVISGFAKRAKINDTSYAIYDCRLVLLPNLSEISGSSARITNEIRRLAESCVENEVCTRFARIGRWNFIESTEDANCPLSTPENVLNHVLRTNNNEVPDTIKSLQSIINKLVDIALAKVIASLKKDDHGMMAIPNVEETFTAGKINGEFSAFNGTFGDLTTTKRTADAVISGKGYKYEASCGFGISSTRLHYNSYKLKYGFVKVDGHVDADIDGVSLDAKVSFDYTKPVCVAKVEKLQVSEFGKIKMEITGLGKLNSLVSKLAGWIGEKWKTDITAVLEEKLRDVIESQLFLLDCEKYRP